VTLHVTLFGISYDVRVTAGLLRWGGRGGREAAEDEYSSGAFARSLWWPPGLESHAR
jgi:hypothetical protein